MPTFDPYDYAIHEDPYPTYAALRDRAPAYFNDQHNFWALSRHADVGAAFRDSDRFSSADGVSLDPAATGPQASRVMSFLAMDQPRHGQMRRLVSKGFTPRRVLDLEPRVRAITDEHLAQALDAKSFDFIDEVAGKVPMDVVSELLGVPVADRAELRRLADVVVHREDGVYDVPVAAATASLDLAVYYLELIADRRRHAARRPHLGAAWRSTSTVSDSPMTIWRRSCFSWSWRATRPRPNCSAIAGTGAGATRISLRSRSTDPSPDPGLGRGDASVRRVEPDPGAHVRRRRRAPRPHDSRRVQGPAAHRRRQSRRARVRRAGPLRPRPRHLRAADLRQRSPLLPRCLARAARDTGRPGAAAQPRSPPTSSTRTVRAGSTRSTCAASPTCRLR